MKGVAISTKCHRFLSSEEIYLEREVVDKWGLSAYFCKFSSTWKDLRALFNECENVSLAVSATYDKPKEILTRKYPLIKTNVNMQI